MLNIRQIGGALYFYWLETVVRSWVRFRRCKEKSQKRHFSVKRKNVALQRYSYSITVSKNVFLALQSLQLTVLQFWKTIFLRYSLQYYSFGKQIVHTQQCFHGFNSWQVKQGLFPCFRSPKNMLFNTFSIYEPL